MIGGADPGLSGGVAKYLWQTGAVSTLSLVDCRHTECHRAEKFGLSIAEVFARVRAWADEGLRVCVFEDVDGRGGQDASRAFKFGYATGVLRASLEIAGIQCLDVAPSVWKGALRVPGNKTLARARATELIPAGADQWAKSDQDGNAEAAMLAYYGAHVLGLGGCPMLRPPKRARKAFTASNIEAAAQPRQEPRRH